jgi:hypothetical protein
VLDRVPPEPGLADAGLAPEHQRPRAVGDGRRERIDPSPLGLAPDDLRGAGRALGGGGIAHSSIIAPATRLG